MKVGEGAIPWRLPAIAVVLGAVAATGFMLSLVFLNYNAAEQVRKALLVQAQRETEKMAISIEHFLSERRDNMASLSHSRELNVYFENKALGMSMEYGLRQSLPPILEKFEDYLETKRLGSEHVFSRFLLTDVDGRALVDTASHGGGLSSNVFRSYLDPSLRNAKVLLGGNDDEIFVSIAHYFKGGYVGQIVAWLNRDCLYHHLLNDRADAGTGGTAVLLLRERMSKIVGAAASGAFSLPSASDIKVGGVFEYLEPDGHERLAICAPIGGSPFVLLRVMAADDVLGRHKPWHMLVGISCLALLIMGGAFLSIRQFLKSRILGVRLAGLEAREKAVSEKNAELELEVQERMRAQESFNILRMEMEDVPLNVILNMALGGLGGISWLEVMDRCTIQLFDEESGELRGVASSKGYGSTGGEPCCGTVKLGECLCGAVAVSRNLLFMKDDEPGHKSKCGIVEPHSHYVVPLHYGQRLLGVLNLVLGHGHQPDRNSRQFIQAFADVLSFIIQRRRADEELQLVHEANRALINSIPLALITLDAGRHVLRFNPIAVKLFKKNRDDVLGKDIGSCGIQWDFDALAQRIDLVLKTKAPAPSFEMRIPSEEGTEFFLNVVVSPLADFGPRVAAKVLIVASDVTEQKTLESQLLLAQKLEAIGELAAGIAHEINTPIQYIGSNLQFLQDAFKSFSDYIGTLDSISKDGLPRELTEQLRLAAEKYDLNFIRDDTFKAIMESVEGVYHVSEITKALKAFSTPTKDKLHVDINGILSNTVTVSRNEWKSVAELKTEFQADLPFVFCVPSEIGQVFLNIIINAVHAISAVVGKSGSKGTITISSKLAGSMAEIRIKDTGVGIPDSIKRRVFDPFFTTNPVGMGTGQGLSVARNVIVKRHGGELFFESEQGKGTTFFIRLPVSKAEPLAVDRQ